MHLEVSAFEGPDSIFDLVKLPASKLPLLESSYDICNLGLDRTPLVEGPGA